MRMLDCRRMNVILNGKLFEETDCLKYLGLHIGVSCECMNGDVASRASMGGSASCVASGLGHVGTGRLYYDAVTHCCGDYWICCTTDPHIVTWRGSVLSSFEAQRLRCEGMPVNVNVCRCLASTALTLRAGCWPGIDISHALECSLYINQWFGLLCVLLVMRKPDKLCVVVSKMRVRVETL